MGAMTLRHLISERAGVRRAYVLRSLGWRSCHQPGAPVVTVQLLEDQSEGLAWNMAWQCVIRLCAGHGRIHAPWLFAGLRSSLCPCADIFPVSWDDTFKPCLFLFGVEGIIWRCFRPDFPVFYWVKSEDLSLAFYGGFWSLCTGTWTDLLFDALKLIWGFWTYL
jgi:hypothetical protein